MITNCQYLLLLGTLFLKKCKKKLKYFLKYLTKIKVINMKNHYLRGKSILSYLFPYNFIFIHKIIIIFHLQ